MVDYKRESTKHQDEIQYSEIKWYTEESEWPNGVIKVSRHWNLLEDKETAFLPDVEEIGPGQGGIPWNVKRIVLHPNTKRIGNYAFACSPIKHIDLCNVEYIGANAFSESQVRDLVIPASVKFVDQYAFSNVRTHIVVIFSKDVVLAEHSIERHFQDVQNLFIYGYPGSTTEEYCSKHDFPFYDIAGYSPDNHPDSDIFTMDFTDPRKCSYYATHPYKEPDKDFLT